MAKPQTVHTLDSLMARCTEEGDCMFWDGYFQNGTPQICHEGKMVAVRKLVFQLEGRKATTNALYYAPKCGNPACVVGHHVQPQTPRQHAIAMGKKVNHRAPARIAKLQRSARERGLVKVNQDQINAILADQRSGPEIAKDHNITRSLVSKFKTGKRRRFVSAVDNPWAGLMR